MPLFTSSHVLCKIEVIKSGLVGKIILIRMFLMVALRIYWVLYIRGGMMIKVKTLTGKEIEIDIDPTDTIERIKERVEEKEGIPPVQQRCACLI